MQNNNVIITNELVNNIQNGWDSEGHILGHIASTFLFNIQAIHVMQFLQVQK